MSGGINVDLTRASNHTICIIPSEHEGLKLPQQLFRMILPEDTITRLNEVANNCFLKDLISRGLVAGVAQPLQTPVLDGAPPSQISR